MNYTNVYFCGDRYEFKLGEQFHRIDGPAIEFVSGTKKGNKEWFLHGLLHRENGPAVEDNGLQMWYFRGKAHRLDGPAYVLHSKYELYERWFRNGIELPTKTAIITRSIEITISLSPLQLPAYVVLWIMEWVCPYVAELNQLHLITMIQNLRVRFATLM